MAKVITPKLEGLQAFKSGLKKYEKALVKAVDSSFKEASQAMVADAKAACEIPSIAAGISFKKVDARFEITTKGEESAYLEFGTGNYAKVLLGPYPQDWVDMARTFFINGMGRTAAKPYLYPAYQRQGGEAVLKIIDKIEAL